MRHDDRKLTAAGQFHNLADVVLAPGIKGHLQQEDVAALHTELWKLCHVADAREIEHLRAENDLRRIGGQGIRQAFPGRLTAFEEAMGGTLGRIEVRGGDDGIDLLLPHGGKHLKAHLHASAAVVDARENMAVEIDHPSDSPYASVSAVPAPAPGVSSPAASRNAFFLLPVELDWEIS